MQIKIIKHIDKKFLYRSSHSLSVNKMKKKTVSNKNMTAHVNSGITKQTTKPIRISISATPPSLVTKCTSVLYISCKVFGCLQLFNAYNII